MKTNHWWIKTDYKVQTAFGYSLIALVLGGALLAFFSKTGFLGFFLSLLFLMPIGAWQVISGLIYAFNGDRLQQIYLGVVAVFFGIWYIVGGFRSDYFTLLMVIAVVVAVWKYTVVRADYISLKIIDVPKMGDDNFLGA
jgi:hypothetical protein